MGDLEGGERVEDDAAELELEGTRLGSGRPSEPAKASESSHQEYCNPCRPRVSISKELCCTYVATLVCSDSEPG